MGTVVVAFTINRSGGVVGSRLVRSSGDPMLDAKAVSTPRSASPVPAPPPDVGGSIIMLTVPIRYSQ
jgi:protein TonB